VYSGTVNDLDLIADPLYRRVDETLKLSRLYREAFAVNLLDECMTHLTDARRKSNYPNFDAGDHAAWTRLEAVREWILHGPPCARCGMGERTHSNFGDFCLPPSGMKGPPVFSRFKEKRCEVNACGRPLIPGGEFCEDHSR